MRLQTCGPLWCCRRCVTPFGAAACQQCALHKDSCFVLAKILIISVEASHHDFHDMQLADASTLKAEVVSGVDIMIVRELVGGIYFGEPRVSADVKRVTTYHCCLLPSGERNAGGGCISRTDLRTRRHALLTGLWQGRQGQQDRLQHHDLLGAGGAAQLCPGWSARAGAPCHAALTL